MHTALTVTKVTVPSANKAWVSRPRVMARLQEGQGRLLTLLCAAAGSGKTTAVSQYSAGRGDVAWVSLDAGDGSLAQFTAYVAAALQRVEPGIGADAVGVLHSSGRGSPLEVGMALVNDLALLRHDLTLVLDDYHLAETEEIRQLVAFVVEHVPPQVHLVIVSQNDPQLPLARLRARGQLIEIRGDHLRFNVEEATQFLRKTMRVTLPDRTVRLLIERTEGWAAGLQLATLALRDSADATDDLREAADLVGGGHRYLFDYLAEEVFRNCSADTQEFLLQTCLLERICGPLCDAVTGRTDGQATLERLERANLFIVPLDGDRQWFRYHWLFGEFLKGWLQRTRPGGVLEIYRKAAAWAYAVGEKRQAIQYWLLAHEFSSAADALQAISRELLSHGEVNGLLNWVTSLPARELQARPSLALAYAWAKVISTGSSPDLVELLRSIEQTLDEHETGHRAEIAAIRASLALQAGDISGTMSLAREALSKALPDDWRSRGLASMTLGWSSWLAGSVRVAAESFASYAESSLREDHPFQAAAALFNVARCHALQGELQRAVDVFERALQIAAEEGGSHLPVTSLGHTWLSEVLLELDRLDEARHHAVDGVACCRPLGNIEATVHALVTLSRVMTSQGNLAQALACVDEASEAACRHARQPLLSLVQAARIHLALARGDTAEVREWVSQGDLTATPSPRLVFEQLTLGRALVALERPDEAVTYLKRLLETAENAACPGWATRVRVVQAIALRSMGDAASSTQVLETALAFAERTGFRRCFLDEGRRIIPVLSRASGEFAAELRSRLSSPTATSEEQQPRQGLLSDRELEILRLMADGLSNQDIATRLFVTQGTAKWHIHNILSKLGAASRTQAVARARDMRLLD